MVTLKALLTVGDAGRSAALQLEVLRLREQNAALAGQVRGYAADVAALVSLGRVGHANPKQKLQYNTGWVWVWLPPHWVEAMGFALAAAMHAQDLMCWVPTGGSGPGVIHHTAPHLTWLLYWLM